MDLALGHLSRDHIHLVRVGHGNPNLGDRKVTGLLPWSLWQESNGQFNFVHKMWKLGSWPANVQKYRELLLFCLLWMKRNNGRNDEFDQDVG